jgi:hypothetical protein
MASNINDKIIQYCVGALEKQEGNGECWTLTENALKKHGGKTSKELTPDSGDQEKFKDADYIWGTSVDFPSAVQAGDILQFRDFAMTVRIDVEITYPDGSIWKESTEVSRDNPHHTAIVASISGDELSLYEQNVPPKGKKVQKNGIYAKSKTFDPVTTQESQPSLKKKVNPVTKEETWTKDGPPVNASVTRTKTVSISGKIWAYRPIGP